MTDWKTPLPPAFHIKLKCHHQLLEVLHIMMKGFFLLFWGFFWNFSRRRPSNDTYEGYDVETEEEQIQQNRGNYYTDRNFHQQQQQQFQRREQARLSTESRQSNSTRDSGRGLVIFSVLLGKPQRTTNSRYRLAITLFKIVNPERPGMVRCVSTSWIEPYQGVTDSTILNKDSSAVPWARGFFFFFAVPFLGLLP